MATTANSAAPEGAGEQKVHATKSLVRHGLVYGLGQVALRLGSILLLPVYTRYLTPADYGVIALVDIAVGLLGIVLGGQTASAVTRQHFSDRWERERHKVWWNGIWFVCLADLIVLAPAALAVGPLAHAVLGPSVVRGELWLLWGMLSLAMFTLEQMGLAYLRAEKKSVPVVALSLGRMVFNIALNLVLLNVLESPIMAVLLGNLLTGIAAAILTVGASIGRLPIAKVEPALFTSFWKFSAPMLVTALASLVMHESGRYSLRLFADMSDVGVYGLAQQIGQGANSLIIMPFTMIYGTMVLEVASRSYAHWFYTTVFRVFAGALGVALLSVSLLAPEIFALLIGPNFHDATALVPLTCLAYFFFSLHTHFAISAVVAQRTSMMIPASIIGAGVAVGANWLLVPLFGAIGSGVAAVLAFCTYSFGGLALYRRIDKIDFALGELTLLVGGAALTFLLCSAWRDVVPARFGFVLPVVACGLWAGLLCWRHKWLNVLMLLRGQSQLPAAVSG